MGSEAGGVSARECGHMDPKSPLNKGASLGGRAHTHRRPSDYVNCSFWKILKARQN